MLELFCLIWLISGVVSAFENWPQLSQTQQDAWLTQRDVGVDIPLDQLSYMGASLNQLIFEPYGYNSAALSEVLNLLDVKTGGLMLDLYWNEVTQRWQLCPAPFPNNLTSNLTHTVDLTWKGKSYRCEPGLSPADLMTTINLYLRLTNTNLEANIVMVLLNLKSIFSDKSATRTNYTSNSTSVLGVSIPSGYNSTDFAYLQVGNNSLAQSVSRLGSYLFTPSDLSNSAGSGVFGNYTDYYKSAYPTQYSFLFTLFKRTMVQVLKNEVQSSQLGYNISAADNQTIFYPDVLDFEPTPVKASSVNLVDTCIALHESSDYNISVFSEIVGSSFFRTVVDDDETPFTNTLLRQWVECGYSPIINSSYSKYQNDLSEEANDTSQELSAVMSGFVPNQYWSWAENQPDSSEENSTRLDHDWRRRNGSDAYQSLSDSQFAYNCVAMTLGGWAVKNCYDEYRVACQNQSNPFDWSLLLDITSYLSLKNDDWCPDNYTLAVPHLSVEHRALLNFLHSNSILAPVWIDLNDITISGCYVTGGPYAECPYKRIVTTRNLIKRIAPSVVVSVVIIILIFWERFFLLIPIHTNRKRYWKRKITLYNKEYEYEGVPS